MTTAPATLTSPEAERYIVGCLMVADQCMPEAAVRLTPADFADPALSAIFGVMVGLYRGNVPYSLPAAVEALRAKGLLEAVGGVKFLIDLCEERYMPSHFTYYALIVQDLSNMRKMERALRQCADNAYHVRAADHAEACAYFADTAKVVSEIANASTASLEGKTLIDVLDAARIQASLPKDERPIAKFNLIDLDGYGQLLQRGRLMVVAARAGGGKSTVMLHAGLEAARQGHKVFFVSLEMPDREISERVVARETERARPETGYGPEAFAYVAGDAVWGNMRIHSASGIRVAELYALAKDAKRRGNLDMLIVDYLQLVRGPKCENRQQEVAAVSRAMKSMAMELDVPVISGAQLNRQADEFAEPSLDHLRESGEIGQSADSVLMVWEDKKGAARLRCKLAKNRAGPKGEFELEWNRGTFTLRNASILGEDLMVAEKAWR